MFEPNIVGFLCNWCSYAGADLAGVSRLQYPSNLRVIRVMCSGRIDPHLLIEALEFGADGILISGCHPGDCHYISGNYNAVYKILFAKKLIEKIGINPDRIHLDWVSASEGERFKTVVTDFTNQITELGPLNSKNDEKIIQNLKIAKKICLDFNFRWLIGKSRQIVELGNVYNETIEKEKYIQLLDEIIDGEIIKKKILDLIDKEPLEAIEIANKLSIPPNIVMKNLVTLKTRLKVGIKMEGHHAKFAVI